MGFDFRAPKMTPHKHLIEPRQYRQRSAPLSNKEYHVEFGDSTACSGSIGYAAASVGDAAV